MGLGGGSILLLYLTLFAGMGQLKAQGINLIFFLPSSAFALFLHSKQGLIDKKAALTSIMWGVPGAVLGAILAPLLGGDILRKLFAFMLLVLGIRELFPDRRKKK